MHYAFARNGGYDVASGGVIPADFLEAWLPSAGFFQADDGTTSCTATGQEVRCWTGRYGTRLRNTTGGNYCTFRKNAVSAGLNSARIDSGLLAGEALPLASSINRRGSTILILYERRVTDTQPIVNLASAVDDFSTGEGHLLNGYQRPAAQSISLQIESPGAHPLTGYAAVGISGGVSATRLCVNDRVAADRGAMSAGTFLALGIGTFPGLLSGGDLAGVWLYTREMTAPQLRVACRGVMALGLVTQPPRAKNIIFSGNSITRGVNSSYRSFADVACGTAGISLYDYEDWGTDGATTDLLVTRDTTLAPTLYRPGLQNTVVLWELTNSLASNVSAVATLASHAAWVAVWRNAGFTKVVFPNVIARTAGFTGGQDAAGFAIARTTVNAALAANLGAIYGDTLVDVSAIAPGADNIHPDQAGHTSIGGLVGAAL